MQQAQERQNASQSIDRIEQVPPWIPKNSSYGRPRALMTAGEKALL